MAVCNSAGGKAVDNVNCFINSVGMRFPPTFGLNQVAEKQILCPAFILLLAYKLDILQTRIGQVTAFVSLSKRNSHNYANFTKVLSELVVNHRHGR